MKTYLLNLLVFLLLFIFGNPLFSKTIGPDENEELTQIIDFDSVDSSGPFSNSNSLGHTYNFSFEDRNSGVMIQLSFQSYDKCKAACGVVYAHDAVLKRKCEFNCLYTNEPGGF